MQTNVIQLHGAREAPKASQSRMETLIITPEMVGEWRAPQCQRQLRINAKVREVSEHIRQTEAIEGVVTLGMLKGDRSQTLYIVDGQHRLEAFKLSGLTECIVDVRIMSFTNMTEMAEEFVRLQTQLVKMKPDDIMRGLEQTLPAVAMIRKHCEFVGYDSVRRGGATPILSMSALIRSWVTAGHETPSSANNSGSAASMAQDLDTKSVENLLAFLNIALAAWGRDPEYYKLWGNLNLTMCMWLWNKLVIERDRSATKRYTLLDAQTFKRCLMALSADSDYVQWLVGRQIGERDRTPCFTRIRALFVKRLIEERKDGIKPLFIQPAWAVSR